MRIVLASTSPFRRQLLATLDLPFECVAPDVDESPHRGEPPADLVRRLAVAKAESVLARHADAIVIGSDQVACIDNAAVGKPGDRDTAIRQLVAASGRRIRFLTGLCLVNGVTGATHTVVEPYDVHFRSLCQEEIERYVDKEQPFDCAGSFKSEGYGITLFEKLEGRDPNALIGLPLIALAAMLRAEGMRLP
jgi:MAF protein